MKRDGLIVMTPYSVGKTTVEEFVVSRDFINVDWKRESAYCSVSPGTCLTDSGPIKLLTSWTQNDHIGSLPIGLAASSVSVRDEYASDVADAVSSTQQAAYADALNTYDLLSELAESGETFRYLLGRVEGAAESLREFAHADEPTHERARTKTARDLLRSSDRALRRYGSRWMEYRYAIMPLIYSFKDVRELLKDRNAVFKTGRSNATIIVDLESSRSSDHQTYQKAQGTIEVKSTYKVAYDYGALHRVASQIRLNPFTTAWELIPFSFVVDWFANVGTAVTAATSLDLSSQGLGCTAIKRDYVEETRLWDMRNFSKTKTLSGAACGNLTVSHSHVMSCDEILKKVSLQSYDRKLYRSTEFDVNFDPYLNWKRILDGIVLSYQPTKKLLRSL